MAISPPQTYTLGQGKYQFGAPSPWESMAASRTALGLAETAPNMPQESDVQHVGLEKPPGSTYEFNRPSAGALGPAGGLEAANAAVFGRAKDQAAQTAQASLAGLRQVLQQRGMGGGGYEAGQIGQTLAREANTIGEAGRSQAEKLADLQQRAAEVEYQGGITQRGQDIQGQLGAAGLRANVNQGYNQALLQQRAQDIQQRQFYQQQSLERLRTALSGLGSLY